MVVKAEAKDSVVIWMNVNSEGGNGEMEALIAMGSGKHPLQSHAVFDLGPAKPLL
jgi:hypothetical protein